MAPERDNDLPPVQPVRRTAVVRGLRPRLWSKRVLPAPTSTAGEARTARTSPPGPPPSAAEDPITYDDHAHLHGGPGGRPRVDLED